MNQETTRAHVLEAAEWVQDMGSRVVSNGGEQHYAREKMFRALRESTKALALLGCSADDLIEAVREKHETWSPDR